jgi:hypothetical protein
VCFCYSSPAMPGAKLHLETNNNNNNQSGSVCHYPTNRVDDVSPLSSHLQRFFYFVAVFSHLQRFFYFVAVVFFYKLSCNKPAIVDDVHCEPR